MPDLRISELPAASALADTDLQPLVQSAGGSTLETRRATLLQLRGAVLADRGVHVRDYGARGDGTTNDAPAIQAAVNDLQSRGGGTLLFGPRSYRLASAVTVTNTMVRMQGAGFTEGAGAGQGTWLSIDGTGFTPFTFSGTAARGSAVCDIAVQQAHPTTFNASWAPTDYPYVFRVEDCLGGVDFDNVFLARVTRGIFCRNSGRLDVRRLRGQVFTTALEVDTAFDTPRLHSLHLWTFWSADSNVVRWQQANGDALVFRRCDGVFVDQAFVLGYRSMFRFASSAAGITAKFYIGQAYADFVRHGVWIEGNATNGQIANLTTQGEIFGGGGAPIAGSVGILVDANNTRVQVGNLRLDDAEDNAIRVNGTGNRLDIASLRCVAFNTRNNGSAAIHLADSAAAPANAVYLGAPALLESGNGGPLVNGGTNGVLASQAPAGRSARPGLAVGAPDTGLFQNAAGALAASVGGGEVLRATAAGLVTLGASPGGHALEVAAPPGGAAANRLVASGAAAGAGVSLAAQGSDANISLSLLPKGTGLVLGATPPTADTSTALATTAWVRAQGYGAGGGGGGAVTSVAGRTGAITLAVADVSGAVARAGDTMTGPLLANSGGAGNAARVQGAAAGAPVVLGADASSADANVGVVLAPRGTGALSVQAPDATAVGGNARGAGAVDWQGSRNNANQVASGASAAIGGGLNNRAGGTAATIAGGQTNIASAIGAAVAGGQNNTADGQYAWTPGGLQANARGAYGKGAFAAGQFAAAGDAQAGEQVLRRQGTDATAQRLTADGAAPGGANSANLPNAGTFLLRLMVVARQTGGTAGTAGDSAAWDVTALVRRGASAAATALVAGGGAALAPTHADAAAAGWRLAVAADTANGGVAVSGTGEANKSLSWVARVASVEAVG